MNLYRPLESIMANTTTDNTSMNTEAPAPAPLATTEKLGEGEFFIDMEDGTRKFFRMEQIDGAERKNRGKNSSLRSKGIVKKKKKKDPNAPKKAQTAYLLFLNKKRESLRANLEADGLKGKELITTITKVASEQWKTLPEGDKKEYNDLYLQDKQRYDEEMKTYQPPADDETAA